MQTNSFGIYVPTSDELKSKIIKGSAVVEDIHSFVDMDIGSAYFTVDFEGDLYNNGWTFRQKLYGACYRHATKYPTIARTKVTYNDVTLVGDVEFFDWKMIDFKILRDFKELFDSWIN